MTRAEFESGDPRDAGASRTPEAGSSTGRWVRRLAAMVFGLSLVLAAEAVCRSMSWGDPNLRDDPFVGFSAMRPLFVKSDDGSEYFVPSVRQNFFAPEAFPAKKGERVRRVFCLGGSTVQGRPYSIPTAFTTWLELALNANDMQSEWEVVNCGGISYASYRLAPILEECLQYEPDLFILCTGHNEFLEDRSYGDVSRSPLLHRASRLRLVNLARELADSLGEAEERAETAPERTTLPMETQPILDFNGGLAVYHRDDRWRRGVIEHYEVNVRRMIRRARTAGVPILLMQPASNLRDSPPFKSEHRSGLTLAEESEWNSRIVAARAARIDNPVRAVAQLEEALAIDAEFALTHYELAQAQLMLRDHAAARAAFVRARDLDVCPLRMPTELEQRLAAIAEDEAVTLINMQSVLEALTTDGILGDGQLVDHIHPSIEGHQKVADALVVALAEQGWLDLPEDWQAAAAAAYAAHFATLESAYFLRGQRMLYGLREWSQGRADGPPASERFPGRATAQ